MLFQYAEVPYVALILSTYFPELTLAVGFKAIKLVSEPILREMDIAAMFFLRDSL